MERNLEVETSTAKKTTFRIFQKLPFKIQLNKKTTEFLSLGKENEDNDDFIDEKPEIYNIIEGQLAERTDILECAWHRRQDASDSELDHDHDHEREELIKKRDHLREDRKSKKTNDKKEDIYGKLSERPPNEIEHIGKWLTFLVYLQWMMLFVSAYFMELLWSLGIKKCMANKEDEKQTGFAPLYNKFEALYMRNCYMNARDVFERPIGSVPGATVNLLDRYSNDGNWTYQFSGKQTNVINVASYNYLGFAQSEGPCADAAVKSIEDYGIAQCTTTHERGASISQKRLERLVAEFLGVEDAICFAMGFATNSMNAPCLVDKHSLIVSDKRNHASLILGCKLSGASTKVFEHNDMRSLEKILRDAIAYGNPKTHRPYRKILIVVEGIYSMEGSICDLPGIIALKNKYNCYLYLDEAHSVGAMGSSGRGVVEYWGCDPKEVDILMGTFTKSFGSAGGYIAGSKKTIDHLRLNSPTGFYSSSMSPPVAEQIYSSMGIIMGKDGTNDGASRIERLARNASYLRRLLKREGYIVYGSDHSPVVPLLIFKPNVVVSYGREMMKRNIGVVVVGFPATEMTEARVRFCVSAAHTKEQLYTVVEKLKEINATLPIAYSIKNKQFKGTPVEW